MFASKWFRALLVSLATVLILLAIRALVPPSAYVVRAAPRTAEPAPPPTQDLQIPPAPPSENSEVGLCLSGGGYRATLFGLGAVWRLNELGALRRVSVVSSASGGSILAAYLVLHWPELDFDPSTGVARKFREIIADKILDATSNTIDRPAILESIFSLNSASHLVAKKYDSTLFRGATLASLPSSPQAPRLYVNATRLEDGTLWSFSQNGLVAYEWPGANPGSGELGDDRKLPLSLAVAASSSFPPLLAPVRLNVESIFPPEDELLRYYLQTPGSNEPEIVSLMRARVHEMHNMASKVTLVDGGVRNNLATDLCIGGGLTVVVDSAVFTRESHVGTSWPAIMYRVVNLMYEAKESANRRLSNIGSPASWRALVDLSDTQFWLSNYNKTQELLRTLTNSAAFSSTDREAVGSRWPSSPDLDAVVSKSLKSALLASVDTRLKGMNRETQGHLIDIGYIITDAAMLGNFHMHAYGNSIINSPKPQPVPAFLPNILSAKFQLPFPAHNCLVNAQSQCGRADFEGK
jgi:NTE family protein